MKFHYLFIIIVAAWLAFVNFTIVSNNLITGGAVGTDYKGVLLSFNILMGAIVLLVFLVERRIRKRKNK